MSVQSEIERISNNVADTYSVLESAGATAPASYTTDNLPETAKTIAAVLYNKAQELTDEQQEQARINIGAIANPATAAVGQTILVEEVDEDGKPTKWKAVDYQPRTHWTEEVVVLEETTAEVDAEVGGIFLPYAQLAEDGEYRVVYNGAEYISGCHVVEEWALGIGNVPLYLETGDNGMPFVVLAVPDGDDSCIGVMPCDGSTSVTISIAEIAYTPIPVEYVSNAFPYYIEVTGSGTDDDPYVCNDTVANVEAIYRSGRSIVMRVSSWADTDQTIMQRMMYSLSAVFDRVADGIMVLGFTYVLNKTASSNSFTSDGLWLIPQEDGTYIVGETIS